MLSLNHVDFWRDEVDEEVPDYAELTAEARRLILEGRVEEANRFIDERFVPTGLPCNKRACQDLEGKTNAFCPIGDLVIELDAAGEVTEYERTLDLMEGIARVEFATPAGRMSQEFFIPLEHDVIVAWIRADHAPRWRMRFDRQPQELYEWSVESEDGGLVEGRVTSMRGGVCRVRIPGEKERVEIETEAGESFRLTREGERVVLARCMQWRTPQAN